MGNAISRSGENRLIFVGLDEPLERIAPHVLRALKTECEKTLFFVIHIYSPIIDDFFIVFDFIIGCCMVGVGSCPRIRDVLSFVSQMVVDTFYLTLFVFFFYFQSSRRVLWSYIAMMSTTKFETPYSFL